VRTPAVVALVDDDPAVRHAICFAFETAGIPVIAYSDAESALLAQNPRAWRCLILDQRLPGGTGLNLLAKLRADGVSATCFLITSHPSRELKSRALLAGVEIVEKPLLDGQLLTKVRKVMADAPR